MKLKRALLLCLVVATACHMPAVLAEPFASTIIAGDSETTSDTGTAGQRAGATTNHLLISEAPSSDQSESSGTKTLTFKLPLNTKTETVKVVLNGKVVTSRFHAASCSQALCQAGTLSSEDGLRPGKNVLYVVAKKEDGTAISSRLRFAGLDTQTAKPSITGLTSFRSEQQPGSTQSLPTASSFLPPTISLSTVHEGGVFAGQPWLNLGTQTQLSAAANCTGYTVTVLDRQTLVEKTSAPESSPSCQPDGVALNSYLKGLTSNDLVIVGTLALRATDAGAAPAQLNTSAIGGSAYNCNPNVASSKMICAAISSTSPDIPLFYVAIGAGGAAPGSAYESYNALGGQLNPDNNFAYNYAVGMLTEDANGNYNFQSSSAVEYIVSPGTAPGGASVSMTNPPMYPSSKVVYRPPAGTNGFWMLTLNRGSLEAFEPVTPGNPNGPCATSSSSPAGEMDFDNCGVFYQTGPGVDAATLTANYKALAQALTGGPPIDRHALIILTTVGTPLQGSIWDVANNNANSNFSTTWTDDGYNELATAFRQFGIPDTTVLSLGANNSALTYITSPGLGNSLSGQSVLSTTAYSQQGQSGYVHGLLTRDLRGLYRPGHSEQQTPGSDGSNFTMGLVSSYSPVDWPELASQMPGADSLAGQKAAYAYLSWYLLNAWYVQSESGAQGVAAPFAYDIHYFFTGSLNTFIDYHTFDPTNAVWPGTPGFSGGWNHPCSLSGSTCTWTSPLDGTILTFTQNDFNAVKTQLHNEVVDLTNVLLFMVNGSTNMKDVVAAGNSNVALTLIGAASTVSANLNEPAPSTPATVSVPNILSMVGGGLTTVAAIASLPVGGIEVSAAVTAINGLVDVTADLFSDAAGAAGGFTNAGSSALPSPDSILNTTIGQIANGDLQDALLAGFDTTLDTITGDWEKLNAIGPLVTDPTNQAFFSPNQVEQSAVIGLMTQASQRSLYLSLLPAFYQVQYWPQVNSESMTATNYPDMGSTRNGDTNSCKAFYTDGYDPPPAYVSAWYPSIGGAYFQGWMANTYAFQFDWAVNPIDYYVLALPFQNVGATDTYAHYITPSLANLLFGTQQGALNFPLDAFVAHSGPMDLRLDGQPSSFSDLSIQNPNSGQNLTGHYDSSICSVAQLNNVGVSSTGVGSAPGGGSTGSVSASATTLNAPGSAVLGESVPLQATVAAASGSGPVPSGTVQFRDGSTILSTVTLDGTGHASFTATGLRIGDHALAAYYIANGSYEASNSQISTLTVYATAPDIALSLSVDTLNVSQGGTSSPVTLNVNSQSGMAGTLNFSCTGLPGGMTCNFKPATAMLTAGGTATTTITITDTAAQSAGILSSKGIGSMLVLLPLWCLWSIRRGRGPIYSALNLLLLTVICFGFTTGCGGDAKSQPSLATGSRTILVNASGGSVTRTVPLLVNIQ
jgi:Bacterial Ig-like domain (group 3)